MNLNPLAPNLIFLAATVILMVAGRISLYVRKRRSTTLPVRQKYGSQYDRTVQALGSKRRAEAKLADREQRGEELNLLWIDRAEKAVGK